MLVIHMFYFFEYEIFAFQILTDDFVINSKTV